MKSAALNFHHLRYFWIVAREGSVTRAARRLGVAVQTISVQIARLEQSLGKALLVPQGRRLVPTEAGRLALAYADQIFQLGERMDAALRETDAANTLRLAVGISDALPKLIAYRLMEAVFHLPQQVRLVCREGEFDTLLAELALHRLDVVLTDRPAPHGGNLKVFSHALGDFEITLFGAPALASRYRKEFPQSLGGAPMLLPTRGNALRGQIERWLETHDVAPLVVGEFEDSALLTTFGRAGIGLFPAPSVLGADIAAQLGAEPVGVLDEVREQYYAISNERRIRHPAVEAIRKAPVSWSPATA
ncbi:MAG: LysR family transcriptional regulator [Rhodocyclales bacterium]|nr:LysR family transcriptional regulator [Rhodocyclales bacterium]